MATNCNYLYEELLSTEDSVAVTVVESYELTSEKHVVRQFLENGSNF